MLARRGYYNITVPIETVVGEEVKVTDKQIVGHFSVNFWALLEEELGLQSLGETFAYVGQKIGLSMIRRLVYCSAKAYALENDLDAPYKNLAQCGLDLESFSEDNMIDVITALTESKLMNNKENLGISRSAGDNNEEGEKEGVSEGK